MQGPGKHSPQLLTVLNIKMFQMFTRFGWYKLKVGYNINCKLIEHMHYLNTLIEQSLYRTIFITIVCSLEQH